MISWQLPLFYALLVLARHAVAKLPSPLICEDTLNGEAPFDNNEVPCILGCVHPRYQATLSFLPGSYNETFITFCQAQCVKHDITPDQLGEAQDCQNACHFHQENPEIYGWCLYWCLRGEKNVVESTTCVPSVGYGAPVTTVIGDETVTVSCKQMRYARLRSLSSNKIAVFTEPPAWSRWAKTETVYLPDLRSNLGETGPTSTASAAATTETDVSSDATTTDAFTSSDATTTDASTAGTTSSSSAASRTRAHLFTSQTTSSSTTTTGSQNPQEQNDAKATTTSDGESLDPFGSLFMILVLLLVAVS